VGEDLSAQIVVVATPASSVAGIARRVLTQPGRPPDVVVTDVSGVKGPVVAAVDHPRFVGGHPMAGSEQGGFDGADPELFTGASWVLTPSPGTELAAFDRIQSLVTSLGADVVVLSPEDHDRLVAVVSHVPHLVAATLMNAAARDAEHDAALLRLAAGGFRDMTRIAAGHPGIWPDVCAENAPAILDTLDHLLSDLEELRKFVSARDRAGILRFLADASEARRALPSRAFRPEGLAELRIPVPDREGVLAEVTAVAGGIGVNIYDIEIAHSAEGQRGVLLLLVAGTQATGLRDAVSEAGYPCTVHNLS
jgi:prephenate dehydrogenase